MTVSKENKLLANKVAEIFGTKPSVSRYWDDNNQSHIDILVCEDSPQIGANSYSSIGLSNQIIGVVDENMQLGVELVAACSDGFDKMANVVATCSFNIINSDYIPRPGIVFPNVISMYDSQLPMKHVLFVPPFLWKKDFEEVRFESRIAAWLMIVPISESEYVFFEENGFEALDNLLEAKQIDILNLYRKSAI